MGCSAYDAAAAIQATAPDVAPIIISEQTGPDVMRRAMIEDVLCRFSLDLSRYGGAARFAPELSALAPLAADGLVAIEGDQLTIPLEARPLARLVAKAFDAYEVAAGKHSASV